MLKNIYARDCLFTFVEDQVALDFVKENHRQEATSKMLKMFSIGAFYNDTLVGIAQFCTPRTSKKQREYSTELLRLAFKKDTRVVGGASALINHFIITYNPADIFTYQDATGEVTNVYEHAGFTFVSQEKKKEYLVAPGKTIETGNRKEVLGMPYATQYGPDRILGTKLGEVLDETTGKRKSNKRIFVEDLGWHIETTPGDKVFEWFNPNMTHYVYKITATDSDKYYYGVSHVKKANATIEDCLNDGYYGSGGEKYKNWKKKHKNTLVKKVIQMFDRKSDAYNVEKELVSNFWQEDPLCLNSLSGGKQSGVILKSHLITVKNCSIHHETNFKGDSCMKCSSAKAININNCEVHGENVKFRGDNCVSCSNSNAYSEGFCEIHGFTKTSKGNVCRKCVVSKTVISKNCPTHGITAHMHNNCKKCTSQSAVNIQLCDMHGETSFMGDTCKKCVSQNAVTLQMCEIHGETAYMGKICKKCQAMKAISMKVCEIHGETKHSGDNCYMCVSESNHVLGICDMHGETPFIGGKCRKCEALLRMEEVFCEKHNETTVHMDGYCMSCRSEKLPVEKNCNIHGLVKHYGDTCMTCAINNSISVKNCDIHGEVKHNGNTCITCTSQSLVNVKFCEVHGETKHQGNSCSKCSSEKNITVKNCDKHGMVKHQGNACRKCVVSNNFSFENCLKHGETKHRKGICNKCHAESFISFQDCIIHGNVKHRSSRCMSCMADQTAHTRWHKEKFVEDCRFCTK